MTDYLGIALIYGVIAPACIGAGLLAIAISLGIGFGIPLWIVAGVIGEARR